MYIYIYILIAKTFALAYEPHCDLRAYKLLAHRSEETNLIAQVHASESEERVTKRQESMMVKKKMKKRSEYNDLGKRKTTTMYIYIY